MIATKPAPGSVSSGAAVWSSPNASAFKKRSTSAKICCELNVPYGNGAGRLLSSFSQSDVEAITCWTTSEGPCPSDWARMPFACCQHVAGSNLKDRLQLCRKGKQPPHAAFCQRLAVHKHRPHRVDLALRCEGSEKNELPEEKIRISTSTRCLVAERSSCPSPAGHAAAPRGGVAQEPLCAHIRCREHDSPSPQTPCRARSSQPERRGCSCAATTRVCVAQGCVLRIGTHCHEEGDSKDQGCTCRGSHSAWLPIRLCTGQQAARVRCLDPPFNELDSLKEFKLVLKLAARTLRLLEARAVEAPVRPGFRPFECVWVRWFDAGLWPRERL
jgi:hypothetical protein